MKPYRFLLLLPLLFLSANVVSKEISAIGVWQTEPTEQGYLHVSIVECGNFLCGTILLAYDLQDNANAAYEHIGKSMIWNMKSSDTASWSGGKIWDPSNDKTYKSKMSVSDDILSVSGCILFVCKAQTWTRVQ